MKYLMISAFILLIIQSAISQENPGEVINKNVLSQKNLLEVRNYSTSRNNLIDTSDFYLEWRLIISGKKRLILLRYNQGDSTKFFDSLNMHKSHYYSSQKIPKSADNYTLVDSAKRVIQTGLLHAKDTLINQKFTYNEKGLLTKSTYDTKRGNHLVMSYEYNDMDLPIKVITMRRQEDGTLQIDNVIIYRYVWKE